MVCEGHHPHQTYCNLIGSHSAIPYWPYRHPLGTSEKKPATADNLLQKKDNWKQPTHKTAHLQTAQTDTQPKFAKELFSCRRTR